MAITKTLSIRPLEPEHAHAVAAMRMAPDVLAHVRTGQLIRVEDVRRWMAANTNAVAIYADDDMIGTAALLNIHHEHRYAELSILCPDDEIVPAIMLVCDYGFGRLNLHRIEAETYTPRRRSLLEAAGFQVEGQRRDGFRRNGRWQTSTLLAKLETD